MTIYNASKKNYNLKQMTHSKRNDAGFFDLICTESAAKYVQSFNILRCEVLQSDHALSLEISGFERSPFHLLDSPKQLGLLHSK